MSGPYFQKKSWPPFVYRGVTYGFTHLDEFQFEVLDSAKIMRLVVTVFSDHCFTEEAEEGADPSLRFPLCTRSGGLFCCERYELSLRLKTLIAEAVEGRNRVWLIEGNNFAVVPTVDCRGNRLLYGIVFSLDPVKGLPVDLVMRVRSAYPCDEKAIATYGHVRFAHLVALRTQGKRPTPRNERNRQRPRLS